MLQKKYQGPLEILFQKPAHHPKYRVRAEPLRRPKTSGSGEVHSPSCCRKRSRWSSVCTKAR